MVKMNCAQKPKALLIYIFSFVAVLVHRLETACFGLAQDCVIVDGLLSLSWQIQRLSNADN